MAWKQRIAIQNKIAAKHRHRCWVRVASACMAVVVFCTTYALILPAITMERKEAPPAQHQPESLTFSYTDEEVQGSISLPWSEELPADLSCSVTKLKGTEDNYDALYQSASAAFAAEEQTLSAIQIYQLHWQSAGEDYSLPEGLQPTVQLTPAKTSGDRGTLSGLVFTENPAAPASPQASARVPRGAELALSQPASAAAEPEGEAAEVPRYTVTPVPVENGRAVMPLADASTFALVRARTAVGGHYYKRVDSVEEIRRAYQAGYPEKYVIVYANSVQQAFGTDTWYTAPIEVRPVKGYENEGFFELVYIYVDGANGYSGYRNQQQHSNPFEYQDRHWQICPHPNDSSAFYIWENETWRDELWTSYSDSNRIYLDHDDTTNTWRIHGASNYMSFDELTNTAINITDTSYLSQCNMLLFRYVGGEREILDDISDSENVDESLPKPWDNHEYASYRPVSDGKEGTLPEEAGLIPDAATTYTSDPATANIEGVLGSKTKREEGEALYHLQKENDGRILTDKSVIYGADDYGAAQTGRFGAYEPGDFSVTLSALGQEWMTTEVVNVTSPLDVVYVLDISSSMDTQDSGGSPRWQAAMESLNRSMKTVLEQNDQNRVGLVTFSSEAKEVLPLDRYAPNENGAFLEATSRRYSVSIALSKVLRQRFGQATMDYARSCNLKTAEGLRYAGDSSAAIRANGAVPTTYFDYAGAWDKTYTQLGIQKAYDLFLDMSNLSEDYLTFEARGTSHPRQPVIILVTDGDPTICTYNYMYPEKGPSYGQGESQGVSGFYTLLSANYFKNLTSILYQKKAGFFTIGIDCRSNYTQTVLEPTPERVAACAAENTPTRGQQLYKLLENIGVGTGMAGGTFTQIVKSQAMWKYYFLDLPGLGYTSACIRGMFNPYYSNYNYCDKAWFGVFTEEEMNEAFSEILEQVQLVNNYKFLLQQGTDLVITDHIGEKMAVKGTPVLRFYGKNYAPDPYPTAETDSQGNPYLLYRWTQTVSRVPSDTKGPEGAPVSLQGIHAKVTTQDSGQTVEFLVPEEAMPTYYPDLYQRFYYEELPVRLMYRVGLSQEELADLQSVSGAIPERRYYTSRYEQTSKEALTTVRFSPDESNPYYDPHRSGVVSKTRNLSDTSDYSFLEYVEDGQVVQLLGNNGTLTVRREDFLNLTVEKTWMPGTDPADQIQVALYASGTKSAEDGQETPGVWQVDAVQLDAANHWRYEWRKFPKQETKNGILYTYTDFFLREVDQGGYSVTYQDENSAVLTPQKLQLDTDDAAQVNAVPVLAATVTIVNDRPYTLPHTGGSGSAWLSTLGILLSGGACMVQILRRNKARYRGKGGDR